MRLLGNDPRSIPAILGRRFGCLEFLGGFDLFVILSDRFRLGVVTVPFRYSLLMVFFSISSLWWLPCHSGILSHLLRYRNMLLSDHLPVLEIIGHLHVAMSSAPSCHIPHFTRHIFEFLWRLDLDYFKDNYCRSNLLLFNLRSNNI